MQFLKEKKDGKISPTWREATISISKEGKDKLDCGSFRTTLICNTDYKLYMSILSRRVERVLPQLIHTDQIGFILQRQTHDNVRCLLYVLSHVREHKLQAWMRSVWMQKKVFDSISWRFLYKVLDRFMFHKEFIKGIIITCNNPTACFKNKWVLVRHY